MVAIGFIVTAITEGSPAQEGPNYVPLWACAFIVLMFSIVPAGSVLFLVGRHRERRAITSDSSEPLAESLDSAMADDYSGTVTICKGQGLFLRADDAGLVVRNFYGRTRRIAWTEISHFADGSYTSEGVTGWQLCIVLRTGKQVRVTSSVLAPAGEVVAAVRDAAQPRGIPADLSGIAAKGDGRPASRGLYRDPGGQPGLRYWDGRHWSPLLPPDIGESRSKDAQKAPGSWSTLPGAVDGRWTYPVTRAKGLTVLSAVDLAISAALLAWACLIQVSIQGLVVSCGFRPRLQRVALGAMGCRRGRG